MKSYFGKKLLGSRFTIPLLIYVLSLSLRVWNLDLIPPAISHVELDYVINAKSVWITGKDLSQQWSPLSLTALASRETLAELPQVILAPLIGPFPFSLFNARWPFALLYSLIPVLVFLITSLFFDKKSATVAGLLFCLNPWNFHFSRTAYETSLATLFYLSGIYIFFRNKGAKILMSLPLFFLGFFSYHGAKAVIVPLVLVNILFHYIFNTNKSWVKYYLIMITSVSLLMLSFVLSLSSQAAGGRSKQIIFFNADYLAAKVNQERLLSIPSSFVTIFSNKYMVMAREMAATYVNAFSPLTLFAQGEQAVGGLTLGKHGYFYYIDFLLLIIGLFAAYIRSRKALLLLLCLLLIAPLNSIITIEGQSYVNRAALLFPVIGIFIGLGFSYVISIFSAKKFISFSFGLLYLLYFVNFLYTYFYRNPIYNSEGFFFSKRVLSEYLHRSTQLSQQPVYVYADEHMAAYEQYLFYTDKVNRQNTQLIAYAMSNNDFKIDNITFESGCPSEEVLTNSEAIIILESIKDCKEVKEYLAGKNLIKIVNLTDSGAIFQIINDDLCQNTQLSNYVRVNDINSFDLSRKNNIDFCKQWLVN